MPWKKALYLKWVGKTCFEVWHSYKKEVLEAHVKRKIDDGKKGSGKVTIRIRKFTARPGMRKGNKKTRGASTEGVTTRTRRSSNT